MAKRKLMLIFGTRPEAIKLFPVIHALQDSEVFDPVVCLTGQHREMLDQVMDVAGLTGHADLSIMKAGQTLTGVTTAVLDRLEEVFAAHQPDIAMVQGDTTSAMAGALAAFYQKIPVAHVEAGLRSGDIDSPWPEEMNRRVVTTLAALHFAPTRQAADNLQAEHVPPDRIAVTGNTVIDALLWVRDRLEADTELRARYDDAFSMLEPERRLILVTGHRRENFDGGIARVCAALKTLATRKDTEILYPVHLNPNVKGPVHEILAGCPNVHLLPPQDYLPFIYLMNRADLLITDSGGVQEEAPSLGKPILVTRTNTERPEGVTAGTAKLVGTETDRIVQEASRLLDDPSAYDAMAQVQNPYGDGLASQRILDALGTWWRGEGIG